MMFRLIRNILIFSVVIAVITGAFFMTRGCGMLQPADGYFVKDLRKIGSYPILTVKDKHLTFYPALKNVDMKGIRDLFTSEEIVDIISRQVVNALDTILYLDKLDQATLINSINESIKDILHNQVAQGINISKKTIILPVDLGFITDQYREYIREDMPFLADSLKNLDIKSALDNIRNY
ncbi:hypothetical protein ISS30_05905 [bacterium]|nr:hypothetical protein [FCB group bacterium]MBL7191211.1 hypothetical protein [bacterium]